jgi:hypothetical protein
LGAFERFRIYKNTKKRKGRRHLRSSILFEHFVERGEHFLERGRNKTGANINNIVFTIEGILRRNL